MTHPYAQTRVLEHLIDTGNPFHDCVANITEILRRKIREDPNQELKAIRRLMDVYDDDVLLIPKPPAIAVSFADWEEEIHTIGKSPRVTAEYKVGINIFFYHSELTNNIRKSEIRDGLWEISRILRRNSSLNGLSSKGANIVQGEIMFRVRNERLYQGGIIRLAVPILEKITREEA